MKKFIERYWRKATLKDIADGPFPDARFRNLATAPWDYGKLVGFHHGTNRPYGTDEDWYNEAEVYDAPYAGEGYESFEPLHGPLELNVDTWNAMLDKWVPAIKCDKRFDRTRIYRRKIIADQVSHEIIQPNFDEQNVTVNVDGKTVVVRPLLPSDEINSGDICFVDGAWKRTYPVVGLLQSNADHQYYREVRQLLLQQVAQHPTAHRDDGQWLYGGAPIEEGLYAVIDADGKYLCWTGMVLPSFEKDFIQGNTLRELAKLDPRNFEFTKLRKVVTY